MQSMYGCVCVCVCVCARARVYNIQVEGAIKSGNKKPEAFNRLLGTGNNNKSQRLPPSCGLPQSDP